MEHSLLQSCNGDCRILGNADLKPETSTSYELSGSYQGDNWEMEMSVFRNDVEDLIQRDFDNLLGHDVGGHEVYTYKNVDEARIQGIEVGGRIALNQHFSLNADCTYTDARDETNDERLTDRPRQNASVKLNWQPTPKLTAFARNSYTGNQIVGKGLEHGGYSMVDMGMTYDMTKNLTLRAGVNNVGDKRLSDEAEQLGYTEDPRTWYVGFTSSF